MRQDLIDTIKKLSNEDTKTLSQKALKLSSELGELSDVILPMEFALGERDKIRHRGHLLDEVADIMLVAMSIAFSNGFNEEELDEMLLRKSMLWAEKQQEQSAVDGNIPHEIHITVATVPSLDAFREDCKALGIKPIVLDLHTKEGELLSDMMTSQVVFGTTPEAFRVMDETGTRLTVLGYEVIRKKIEVAPWHPAAPKTHEQTLRAPEKEYYEAHIECILDAEGVTNAKYSALAHNARLSNSVSKRDPVNGNVTMMVTLRDYKVKHGRFEFLVLCLHNELASNMGTVSVRKPIIEYSIFDSNTERDAAWLS